MKFLRTLALVAVTLGCATTRPTSIESQQSVQNVEHCRLRGWWTLKLEPFRSVGHGCAADSADSLNRNPIPDSGMPVEVRFDSSSGWQLRDYIGTVRGTIDASECLFVAERRSSPELVYSWEGGPPLWREAVMIYRLRRSGDQFTGTVEFGRFVSRPACNAPCTDIAEVIALPMSQNDIDQVRKEIDQAEEDERRERENLTESTPERREDLLELLRQSRGPGSCWSVDEN